jgi:hypothetical protein
MLKKNRNLIFIALVNCLGILSCNTSTSKEEPAIAVTVNTNNQFQTIEGFGVNINPAYWSGGNLKFAIDLLRDDLGCTLFRFDCTGLADWLDPARRKTDGSYPPEYLREIYTGKDFTDAWEAFRYLNSKGIEPIFNVSGRIPPALGASGNPKQLADFEGYAEMAVTMLQWARVHEKLKFSLFAPFNETDLSYPEGPGIDTKSAVPAVRAIISKLQKYGLQDVKLIVMDDNGVRFDKMLTILKNASLIPAISKFAVHTYGMGNEQNRGWWEERTEYSQLADSVKASSYKDCAVWMTEFGDLDQTGIIENSFSFTVTSRLMKSLHDGYSACLFWDAFDNLHKHDHAWSTYGLLANDTLNHTYTPKHRFYAMKQVYRFVPPGFRRVETKPSRTLSTGDVYRNYHDTLKHIPVLAFVSPDKSDFTITGINKTDADLRLAITINGLAGGSQNKKVTYYSTGNGEDCRKILQTEATNGSLRIILKRNSIFTLTTVNY